ncbi:MAG TPA: hypothetical protein VIO39_01970 [Methylotenera sp.]
MKKIDRFIVDSKKLPLTFPTHLHTADFWESLGRTVATFGFLEDVLCKAIFAFTATKSYSESEIGEAYDKWLPQLQKALSDQLGGLIDTFSKVVREHPNTSIKNLDELIQDLRSASKVRNVLCHGSWRAPNSDGASLPFFINKHNEKFDMSINKSWLDQTQRHTAILICAVVNTVTHMGWQFPGTTGPGAPIWNQ